MWDVKEKISVFFVKKGVFKVGKKREKFLVCKYLEMWKIIACLECLVV